MWHAGAAPTELASHADGALWARIQSVEEEMQPTDVVHLPHPRFQLHAKLESQNVGGSTKDRAAYWILREAIRQGQLTPHSTVVESSSGNFALSLSWMCQRLGIDFVPVLDPNVNEATEQALRSAWDRVVKVEGPFGAGGYLLARLDMVHRLLEEMAEAYWPNQYANLAGARGHFETTGAELVAALPDLDFCFVATGTGATLAGLSQRFAVDLPHTRVIAVDVAGSVIFGGPPARRNIPGVGSSIRPPLIEHAILADTVIVTEQEEVDGCHRLLRGHGLLTGGSTGCVYSAINRYFQDWDGPIPVVAFLCADGGASYSRSIYDPQWLAAHGLHADTLGGTV